MRNTVYSIASYSLRILILRYALVDVSVQTIQFCTATLLLCCTVVLLHCYTAILLYRYTATPLHCCTAILLYCYMDYGIWTTGT
jgi:hypothetical protein